MTAPTITIPENPTEFEEFIADDKRLASLFEDGKARPEFGEFLKAYARMAAKKDPGVATQIRDETQRALAQMLRENPDVVANLGRVNMDPHTAPTSPYHGPGHKLAIHNPKAPGSAFDKMYADNLDFFAKIHHRNRDPEALRIQEEHRRIQNAYGSDVPSDGGFLIPENLRAELLRVAVETAMIRPRARVVPMDSLRVPFPMIDSTSQASNIYGGVTAFWTEEGAQLADSDARFGRVLLDAKKLTAYSEIPNELMADSLISLMPLISQIYPEAIAWFEDLAFIKGSGVGEPLGYLNAPAMVTVDSGAQAATTLEWVNIVAMYARMLPSSISRAVWIANIDTFPELATMELSTGSPAVWINNMASGPTMTLLGRPLMLTEKVPTLGQQGDISFVDLGYYLIGDRQTMAAMTSEHHRFRNDQTAVRFIQRVDGRPWIQSAITPNEGANALSPFVRLDTRDGA